MNKTKQLTIYFLKGLPASGKSTWAKQKIEEDASKGIMTKRVNKDDLRAMIDNSKHSKEREKFILELRDSIVYESLEHGHNVVVDDTNFSPKHLERIINLSSKFEKDSLVKVDIVEKFFPISLMEAIERDSKRGDRSVGKKVIYRMWKENIVPISQEIIELLTPHWDWESKEELKKEVILVDIDGTLALKGDRSPYDMTKVMEDSVNEPVAWAVRNFMKDDSVKVVFFSARDFVAYEDTKKWLQNNNLWKDSSELYLRDSGDNRKDSIVKSEMLERYIFPRRVKFIIDDREQVVDMWRSLGYTVFHVDWGMF